MVQEVGKSKYLGRQQVRGNLSAGVFEKEDKIYISLGRSKRKQDGSYEELNSIPLFQNDIVALKFSLESLIDRFNIEKSGDMGFIPADKK